MDKRKLKHCRLYDGTEVPDIVNFYLQYACYAESFYCNYTEEQLQDSISFLKSNRVQTSAYKDVPLGLLSCLFSVWECKLSGGVKDFHNHFMKTYLSVNKHTGLLDRWFDFSNYGKSWSYYLDKCIYFKGTALTPATILQADKQHLFRYEYEWVMMHYPSDDADITKQKQDGYLKEMIACYKQAGLSHYRKDDGVAISLKAYLFAQRNCDADTFKHWYEKEYYSSKAYTLITKPMLLHLTLAYKGEADCPANYDGKVMGKIWFAESIAVDNLLSRADDLPKEWAYEFYLMVAMLIAKWSPYDFMDVLDLYFQDFTDFKMKVLENM